MQWHELSMNKVSFIGLIGVAIILPAIPLVHYPFSWLETFFHEFSHCLMTLLTGGKVIAIELRLNGSGASHLRGGVAFLIALAGYFGTIVAGALIYLSAMRAHHSSAKRIVLMLTTIILVTVLVWGHNFVTYLIGAVLVAMFYLFLHFRVTRMVSLFVKFCGLFVMVNAIRSPLELVDGKDIGDGAKLATITGIPEIFWVFLWVSVALLSLWQMWVYIKKKNKKEKKKSLLNTLFGED